jgi:malonyl-CoA/methylmalonyl-CoA synthetase
MHAPCIESGDDVLLHVLPLSHTHGLFVARHCALMGGSSMICLPRFDPKQILADIGRASVFMGVPTFYTRLLAEPSFDAAACENMRLFISGCAPLLERTFRDFETRSGHSIL